MLLLLILLLQWRVTTCTSSPTLEDNMLPTDEEVISDLINSYRGQPEQEIALNLPTDEEAFNEIKPILQSGSPLYYRGSGGHFVSSSFPEIDARGFHESVFNDLDDLYPISPRGKKHDSPLTVSARGFYGDIFTDGFGSFHLFKRNNKKESEQPYLHDNLRKKRSLSDSAVTELPKISISSKFNKSDPNQNHNRRFEHPCRTHPCTDIIVKPVFSNYAIHQWKMLNTDSHHNGALHQHAHNRNQISRQKRNLEQSKFNPSFESYSQSNNERPHKVSMNNFLSNLGKQSIEHYNKKSFIEDQKNVKDMGKSDFPKNVFPNNFANFEMLKRTPEMGQSGFHGDVFHKSFGDFHTVKRTPDMGQTGFHGDVFHNNFGCFDTLRKRTSRLDTKNFNNDAFNRDFGHFDTLRKRKRKPETQQAHLKLELFDRDFGNYYTTKRKVNAGAINADAFYSNFGGFETLKKRQPIDDALNDGTLIYSNVETVKRKPTSAELNGDAFHSNFGNFYTMKRQMQDNSHTKQMKRRPSSNELAGDAFHSNFGDFDTMKRTLTGDAFHSQFGKFDTMKRTLGGDAFHSQFGKFETMKRDVSERQPELVSQFENLNSLKRSPSWFHKDILINNDYTDGLDAFRKSQPRRFSYLRYYPIFEPDQEADYEKFRKFIRNYAQANQFEDLSNRMRVNDTVTYLTRKNSSITSH